MLQHAAARRNTLQHAATWCSTLQHAAPRSTTLQHAATQSNMMQHAATCCNTPQTLQHTATHTATRKKSPIVSEWLVSLHSIENLMRIRNTLQHAATRYKHCNALQHILQHLVKIRALVVRLLRQTKLPVLMNFWFVRWDELSEFSDETNYQISKIRQDFCFGWCTGNLTI